MCWHLIAILFNYFNARSYIGWGNNVLLFHLPFLFVSDWRVSYLCHRQEKEKGIGYLFFSLENFVHLLSCFSIFISLTQSWNIKKYLPYLYGNLKVTCLCYYKRNIYHLHQPAKLALVFHPWFSPVEAEKGPGTLRALPLPHVTDCCWTQVQDLGAEDFFLTKSQWGFNQLCTDQIPGFQCLISITTLNFPSGS